MNAEIGKRKTCTCVVPCYNEEETIPTFYREMKKIRKQMEEYLNIILLFVDDGSGDRTLEIVKNLAKKDSQVCYLSFSRNFGKEAALYAGLEYAKGEFVAVMDVDLQDPPELLPQMYRAVADAILSMEEYNRFSKGIFGWVGFRTKWIPYENRERSAGKTKWSFWKLLLYSIEGMVAFSTKPLMIASAAGVLFCLVSLILMLFLFSRAALYGDPVAGWPSMVCIVTFLGGIQLFCLGITGIYLSKTYLEVKH
ncbi:MAG: glycosyltransferase family 2 protein, partial [Hominisplanchenecus sp.]